MDRNEKIVLAFCLAAAIALSGCASVRSHQVGKPPTLQDDGGLIYRLPKRGISIVATFEQGKPPVLAVNEGEAFADAGSPAYVAKIRRNGVGQTDAEISVSEQGLLSATTAKYTSQIDDFIKALAESAASVATSDGGQKPAQAIRTTPCPSAGSASLTTYIGTLGKLQINANGEYSGQLPIVPGCAVDVTVSRAGWDPAAVIPMKDTPDDASGYFYRVNMPYVVRAELDGVVQQTIVMLPDESPTYYIKLPRALFASTENTTTFTDGVLTKHKQKTDSEAIAALKIPADLLRAYVSALGSFFDAFKSTGLKESQAETQKVLNELQKEKLRACVIAKEQDPAGKSSDTLCAGIAMPSG